MRRIFSEFAAGRSPRAIARTLNAEGVAGPGGRPWGDTTIRGHAQRGTGILRNDSSGRSAPSSEPTSAQRREQRSDILISIERVRGSAFADNVIGDDGDIISLGKAGTAASIDQDRIRGFVLR